MKEFLRNVMGLLAVGLLTYCVISAIAFAWYLVLLVITGG